MMICLVCDRHELIFYHGAENSYIDLFCSLSFTSVIQRRTGYVPCGRHYIAKRIRQTNLKNGSCVGKASCSNIDYTWEPLENL